MGKTWVEISLGTWNLGEGNTKQKKIKGGQKEGRETSSWVWIRDVGEGRCSHLILKRSRAWVGHAILLGSSNDFHSNHPNQGRQCSCCNPSLGLVTKAKAYKGAG